MPIQTPKGSAEGVIEGEYVGVWLCVGVGVGVSVTSGVFEGVWVAVTEVVKQSTVVKSSANTTSFLSSVIYTFKTKNLALSKTVIIK